MLSGLIEAGVDFVVIGGVAASAHGSTFVTLDLDICYATTPVNRERLAGLLAMWNAYPRGVEVGLPFFMDSRTMNASPVLTLVTEEGDIDCLPEVAGVGEWGAVKKAAVIVSAFGHRLPVLELRALISAKRAAGRPKDLQQLPELEALLALRNRTRKGNQS